jgi:hypothetical protein
MGFYLSQANLTSFPQGKKKKKKTSLFPVTTAVG